MLPTPSDEAETRNINETTQLDASMSEEIHALDIPQLVRIEDLFDKELLNKIDYQSLEISIL